MITIQQRAKANARYTARDAACDRPSCAIAGLWDIVPPTTKHVIGSTRINLFVKNKSVWRRSECLCMVMFDKNQTIYYLWAIKSIRSIPYQAARGKKLFQPKTTIAT